MCVLITYHNILANMKYKTQTCSFRMHLTVNIEIIFKKSKIDGKQKKTMTKNDNQK